jgi:predicted AAA+ superfamily ATPase
VQVLFSDRFRARGDSLKYLRGLSLPLFNLNPKEFPRELFGREKGLDELVRLVKARRWIAILGPRMIGKTSLIINLHYIFFSFP